MPFNIADYLNFTTIPPITIREAAYIVVAVYVVSVVVWAIRRLWFHPLCKFPGPPFAAVGLYQCYYDVFSKGGGQLLEQLGPLHEKYGPVVRIGPNHLHFSDYQAYHHIYASGSTFNKDPDFYKIFLMDESSFASIDRRQAKARRELLLPFFSRKALKELEYVIQDKVDQLVDQLKTYHDEPVNMHLAYRCFSLDVIMEYLFGHNFKAISSPKFHNIPVVSMQECLPTFSVNKHFPLVFATLSMLPGALLLKINSSARGLMDILTTCERLADEVLSNPEKLGNSSHETIFHHLVAENRSGSSMPSKRRLSDEVNSLRGAGSDTVGGTCTIGTFYVLDDEVVRERLRVELDAARKEKGLGVQENLGLEALEKLPYLTAVIKESLRLSYGVVTPLPRVVGPENSFIGGYEVPKGTVVAMSSKFIHNNPVLYPDPFKFDPERWLKGAESKALEKWLIPFSAGPRQCLGMNLAWAELYLVFGNVFSKLDMRIHGATKEDFMTFDERFVPVFPKQLHCFVKARV